MSPGYNNLTDDDEAGWLGTGNLEPDFSVAQNPGGTTVVDSAGNTGTFVNGTWTPTPDNTNVSWMSSLPKGMQDALKGLGSPAFLAGLGGAALGYLDRPKPSGGGTTMAYPGAAKIERKLVQGPYGPLAEYTGPGGGRPDYTPFTAPTFGAPDVGGRPPTTPAPSPGPNMSVQAKVDLYKQMAGYGLGPDRIRRIAENMYGPQTDTDWSELTRLAGMTGGIAGGAAPVAAPPPAGIATPPSVAPPAGIATLAPPPAAPAAAPASGGFNTNIAAEYIKYRKLPADAGGSSSAIKSMLEQQYGPQSQADLDAYERAYKDHMDYLASQTAAPAPVATPAPAAAPETAAPVAPTAPSMSEGYKFATQDGGIGEQKYYQNIADFIRNTPDEAAQKQAMQKYGISEADVYKAKMLHNLMGNTGFYAKSKPMAYGGIAQAYAQGGRVQMEDGGFVMTKRAVDGAGGPRGIQQLVPGARMIRGPGTGTSDDIPAVINGENGQTPALLSNGEAYVPKRFVQDQGGPQRMYALMNNLQRKA